MKLRHLGALTASLLIGLTYPALADQPVLEMPPVALGSGVELRAAAPPPLRLGERPGAQIAYLLPAWQVAPLELEEISLWNRMGKTPAKVGFSRMLPEAQRVELGPEAMARAAGVGVTGGGLSQRSGDGAQVWGAEVRVEDAYLIRLRLSEVNLPPGTLFWVYPQEGAAVGPFGLELLDPEGNLWTPPVAGPTLRIEVRLPPAAAVGAQTAGFLIDRASEIVGPGTAGPGGLSLAPRAGECVVDSSCVNPAQFPALAGLDLRRGIAALLYEVGSQTFLCTGGLLTNDSQDLLLITANHCFSNQVSASSLVAVWDYFTDSCEGPPPPLGGLPVSVGSTLVATGATTDFTLVRLNTIPSDRVALGWNAFPEAAAHNTVIHRFSHPVVPGASSFPQRYSRNRVNASAPTCQGVPRPQHLYLTFQAGHGIGGTFGGSSGAPSLSSAGHVLGQLLGGCGPNPSDGCDYRNSEVDGAFSETFKVISSHLVGSTTPCVPDATTMCLHGSRFKVEVEWVFNNVPLAANVVQGAGTSQSGLFFFLDPSNWEFLVKVIDACPLNNRFWVFFAATTDVAFVLTVTDTTTGEFVQYNNLAGQPANAITDTNAFDSCS